MIKHFRNFGLTFLGVLALPMAGGAQSSGTSTADMDQLRRAMQIVQQIYVEEVSEGELIEAAIDGMLRDLDPHSVYLSPEDLTELTEGVSGNFGGLGIQIDMYQEVVRVIAPIDETPAFRAGLKAGDLITELDGEPIYGKSLTEAVNIMRGEIGTDITLRVVREASSESFDVTITRGTIPDTSVWSRIEGEDVAYVRISHFTARTGTELAEAIDKLLDRAAQPLAGLVLDLRSNPGGALTGAVAVADAFLDSGEIVSTRLRGGKVDERFQARRGDLTAGLPVVVLIDGGSASASEIVAAALQDHGRAVLMGQRTFGKGSVQQLYPLTSETGIKLTIARYYSPDGHAIQGVGLTPDIEVRNATLEYLDDEPAFREEDWDNALAAEGVEDAPEDTSPTDGLDDRPELGEAQRPEFDKTDEDGDGLTEQLLDYQLERALDLIKALSVLGS